MKQRDFLEEDSKTGRICELCHLEETHLFPLFNFFLDGNPDNSSGDNIAVVCPPCYRHLKLAMPDGIKSSRTLFAFLINRGAYPRDILLAGRAVPYPEELETAPPLLPPPSRQREPQNI